VNEFLAVYGQYVHALELNGLRDWKENREASTLAGKWNQLVISGGDRHGVEPNANVNLTRAGSFTEFVHEVRRERQSHVLFMPQYAEPWKHRILQSTLAAIRNYPDFPEGSRLWDERVYHPDAEGVIRPLCGPSNGACPYRVVSGVDWWNSSLVDTFQAAKVVDFGWSASSILETSLGTSLGTSELWVLSFEFPGFRDGWRGVV
jgi:hypothetical protein